MAAPDFPSSPTNGQQYTAPSGLVYTYDGAVWLTNASAQAAYWNDTGTALTPATATRNVAVPGGAAGAGTPAVVLGSNLTKARFYENNTLALAAANVSANLQPSGTQDDTTKSSWLLQLDPNADIMRAYRAPGGGALATLLTVDNGGNLIMPGDASGNAIAVGQQTAKTRLFSYPTIPITYLSINAKLTGSGGSAGWAYDDATKSSWAMQMRTDSDNVIVTRFAPGSTAGQNLLTLDNAGNLLITGTVGQKASGTTWQNPSDLRLKTNVRPYARGLADILKLEPIHYTLKASNTETCGFDAATVKDIFPECVGTTRMKLDPDDADETEVLTFDMHAVLVALVNAVKELAAHHG